MESVSSPSSHSSSNSGSEKQSSQIEDESSKDSTGSTGSGNEERSEYIRIEGKFVPCSSPKKFEPMPVNPDAPLEETLSELRRCLLPDYAPMIATGRALTSAVEASSVIGKASSSIRDDSDCEMKENLASETEGKEERDRIYYYANLQNMMLHLEKHLQGLYTAEGIIKKHLGIEPEKANGFPEPGFLRKSEDLDEWKGKGSYDVFMCEAYNDIIPEIDDLSPSDPKPKSEFESFLEESFDSCSKELIRNIVESREKSLQLCNCLEKIGLPKSVKDSDLQSLEKISVHVPEKKDPNDPGDLKGPNDPNDPGDLKGPNDPNDPGDLKGPNDPYDPSEEKDTNICEFCQKFADVYVTPPCGDKDMHMDALTEKGTKDEEKQLLCLLMELRQTSRKNLFQKNKLVTRLVHRKEKQSFEKELDDNAKKMWDLYMEHLSVMRAKRRNGEDLSKMTPADMNPVWAEEMPKLLTEWRKYFTGYEKFNCKKESSKMDQSTVEKFRQILQDTFPGEF